MTSQSSVVSSCPVGRPLFRRSCSLLTDAIFDIFVHLYSFSKPTSEMYEEEIKLTTTETQTNTLSTGGSPNSGNKWTQF